eukprot:m.11764 g.11764  ORF g.11764 m.11764 type:complete len:67 (+) comp6655_c0_seq1:139-339(+)
MELFQVKYTNRMIFFGRSKHTSHRDSDEVSVQSFDRKERGGHKRPCVRRHVNQHGCLALSGSDQAR